MDKDLNNKNELFDINMFPKQAGVLLFAISISRISNSQSAEKCFEYMEHFIPKIIKPEVGLNFVYGDGLYLNSTEEASVLKTRYAALIHQHKYGFIKLLEKKPIYIRKSFNYLSWSQMILEAKKFHDYFSKIKKIYLEDKRFQYLVAKDLDTVNPSKEQIDFILEEVLMFYLSSKGEVVLKNDFVEGTQKWILWCYPGKPLLSEIYLYKSNFFNLKNPENIYENSYYDLKKMEIYDYSKIEINSLGK